METLALVLFGIVLTLALGNTIALVWIVRRRSPISTSFESEALDTLRRLDERVKPLPKPTLSPDALPAFIDALVSEAYDVGEKMGQHNATNGNKVTGRDKQREAMKYATARLQTVGLELSAFPEFARRIEAEVQKRKTKPLPEAK